jgi:hypothetical protein
VCFPTYLVPQPVRDALEKSGKPWGVTSVGRLHAIWIQERMVGLMTSTPGPQEVAALLVLIRHAIAIKRAAA